MPTSEENRPLVGGGADAFFLEGGGTLGADEEPWSLVELVNQLLDKGVVITGEATISVAGVDLVFLGLNVLLTSVATAREQLGRLPSRDQGS